MNPANTKKSEITRAQILKAARDIFSANGFHGARIDKIAKAAEINKQRIYAYFGSKEKLFSEVLKSVFLETAEKDSVLLDLTESDIPRLSSILIHHYFELHENFPYFWRLICWANLEGDKAKVEVLKGIKSNIFGHIQDLYEIGQRQETFNPKVSFQSYLYQIIALSFFYFSNINTMSQTLLMDLSDPKVRERTLRELEISLAS